MTLLQSRSANRCPSKNSTTIACLKTVVFQPLKLSLFIDVPWLLNVFPHKLGFKKKHNCSQLQPKAVSTLALICSFMTSQLCTWLAHGCVLSNGPWLAMVWEMGVEPWLYPYLWSFMDGLWWKNNGKHQLRWNGISNRDFEEININILIHRNCWKKPKNQHVDHWMAAICWCLVLNMAECRFWTCAVRNRNQSNGRIWARWNPFRFRSSWELPLVGGVWFSGTSEASSFLSI